MISNLNCPFCSLGCAGISSINNNNCEALNYHLMRLSDEIFPMIKGNKVSIEQAVKEIKKLISFSKGLHIDGLGCDYNGLKSIFSFAEKQRASVDHCDGDNVADLNNTIQRFGGFFSSFGEVFHRSSLIIFIGVNQTTSEIYSTLKNAVNKPKILFLDGKFKNIKKYQIPNFKKNSFFQHFEDVKKNFEDNLRDSTINKSLFRLLENSEYTTIVYASSGNKELTQEIFNFVKFLNDKSLKVSILLYNGNNNLNGALQYSLWKTGFPLRIQFTDNGPFYDPIEISSKFLSTKKELQIYFSCFDYQNTFHMFKKNIFIGNPFEIKKKAFDVFIPAKIPGINKSGIIHRGDGLSIKKLKKFVDSESCSIEQIIEFIS